MIYLLIVLSAVLFPIVSCVRIYEQCGGEGFRGSTVCDAGLQCYRRSKWFSSCQTSCPAGWECVSTGQSAGGAAKPWDQCGGQGWKGATWCNGGYNCYARSIWYPQCRPSCPSDWLCAGVGPSVVTNPPVKTTVTVSNPTASTSASSRTESSASVTNEINSSTAFPTESGSSNEEEETDDDDYLDDVDGYYDEPDEEFDSDEEEEEEEEEEEDIDFDAMIFDSSDQKDLGGTGLSEEIDEEENASRRRRRATNNGKLESVYHTKYIIIPFF